MPPRFPRGERRARRSRSSANSVTQAQPRQARPRSSAAAARTELSALCARTSGAARHRREQPVVAWAGRAPLAPTRRCGPTPLPPRERGPTLCDPGREGIGYALMLAVGTEIRCRIAAVLDAYREEFSRSHRGLVQRRFLGLF